MSCFIIIEIRPHLNPLQMERVKELRVNDILFKITDHYLLPVIYSFHMNELPPTWVTNLFIKSGIRHCIIPCSNISKDRG